MYFEFLVDEMASGKKKCSALRSKSKELPVSVEGIGLGLGFVKYTRGMGRKRILISSEIKNSILDSPIEEAPTKRMRKMSRLEALPQEALVRIICGVDHEDLKQLFHVSKTIREATLIAKQQHFAYSTPKKKIRVFLTPFDLEESSGFDEIEAPNAPKQVRYRRLVIKGKDDSRIAVSLFS